MISTVFDGADVRARLVIPDSGDTANIVVTFIGRLGDQRLDTPGFGEEFFNKYGIAAIHVTASRKHWYQTDEMDAMIERVREAVQGYGHISTYGSSMGAYAALLYAGKLGADRVVGLSPIFSNDPEKVPWDRRWLGDLTETAGFPHDDMRGGAGRPIERVLFYDPYSNDSRHVDLIEQAQGPCVRVAMPAARHPCSQFLKETGLISRAMLPLFQHPERAYDIAAMRASVRATRRKSLTYWSSLCLRVARSGWPRTALATAAQAAALNPRHKRTLRALRIATALNERLAGEPQAPNAAKRAKVQKPPGRR